MEKMMSFKSMEVTGVTKEEALEHAPFGIQGCADQAYRRARAAHTGAWTAAEEKKFFLDYLAKKSKNIPGVGFYITVESAVRDTRKRPYTIEKFKNEGTRELAKVFQLIDDETDAILAETPVTRINKMVKQVDENGEVVVNEEGKPVMVPALDEEGNNIMVWKSATQAEAFELGRNLYEDGYTGNLHIDTTKKVVSGTATIGRMRYTPSKSAQVGVYRVFGIELN